MHTDRSAYHHLLGEAPRDGSGPGQVAGVSMTVVSTSLRTVSYSRFGRNPLNGGLGLGTSTTSYIFLDQYGRCLTATDATDLGSAGPPQVAVSACNGGDRQKWNPPADLPGDGLGDYREIPTTDG